ncbi:MAG: alpha-ketoglutarate-dependent dioxygenase AlkB [Myxococcota bacterium]
MQLQTRLFTVTEPRLDERAVFGARRIELGGTSFLDHAPRSVLGDDVLFDRLVARMAWAEVQRPMYDRVVAVPRLLSAVPADGPGDPVLDQLSAVLSAKYQRPVDRITLALYRDGRDSVAMHGDRVGEVDDCIVAIVSLRGPRRFLIKPRAGGERRSFDLGHGDLLVMGGACQRDFDHGVPKVASAEPRMAVMLRTPGCA